MAKTYTAQTFDNNFDPANGTPVNVTVITVTLTDDNEDGILSPGSDMVNGETISSVYNGDTITYGNGKFVTGVTFYTSSGGR
ncbi:hypothetical protein OU789_16255, partial [Halocynthiibacter sp. C4]|nr:hypothetical protein [Halocynthiibacter sp. C4]